METTYFLYDKHIFRNYNHDFLEEENILHQTNLISVCYTLVGVQPKIRLLAAALYIIIIRPDDFHVKDGVLTVHQGMVSLVF